jgi:acyl transferase domain-containing protein
VFVFSGKGAQWAGMGHEVLTAEPAFHDRLAACDAAIRAEAGWSVLDVLHGALPEQGEAVIQPTLWAVQVGLAALWRHWGVEPDLVIGHSMGEIAAACEAGSLSIADGAAVVCRRSALIDKWCRPGAMVAVPVGPEEAERAIGGLADRVSVGVINSSHSTVLSGEPEAVDQVVARLGEPGTHGRRVPVRYASHSAHVEPLRDPMLAALADLRPRPGATPMHSTALDRPVEGTELDAAYWMANLRRPVRFAAAVGAALSSGERTLFIEVSPHPLLLGAIEDTAADLDPRTCVVGSLVRGEPQRRSMLTGLATAYRVGCAPRWSAVNRGGRRVDLPTYPWQRRRYWADPALSVPPEPDAGPATPTVTAPSSSPVAGATPAGPYVVNLLAEILGMPLDEVDRDATLSRLGVDSVMATRLRVRVADERGVHLPMRHLLDGRTIADLVEEVAGSRA